MRNKVGTALMVLGAVLVLAGAGLFGYNQYEANRAAEAVDMLMPELLSAIEQGRQNQNVLVLEEIPDIQEETQTDAEPQPEDTGEPQVTVSIDGHDYIGYITIEALELSLPVMAQWSYANLRIAPCYYSGSLSGDDLVLMAHNYRRHFGRISELSPGDSVTFTDVGGNVTHYEVAALDILASTAIEEMTAGAYDLTLFTCTYGGESRVTLRCDRAQE